MPLTEHRPDRPGLELEQNRHPDLLPRLASRPEPGGALVAEATQLLSLWNHAVDNRAWDLLAGLVTPDVHLADSDDGGDGGGDGGGGQVIGLDGLVAHLGAGDPPSHHTVNLLVRSLGADVLVWSRQISITGAGSVASADVLDRLVRLDGGLRLAERVVLPRHGAPGPEVPSWWP